MKVIIFTLFLSSILVPILAPAPTLLWQYPGTLGPIAPSSVQSSSKASTSPVVSKIEQNISTNNESGSLESSVPNESISPKVNAYQSRLRTNSKLGTTSSNLSQTPGSQSNPNVQTKNIRNSTTTTTTTTTNKSGQFSTNQNQSNTDFQGNNATSNPPLSTSRSTTSTTISSAGVNPPQVQANSNLVQDVVKNEKKPPAKKKVAANGKSEKKPPVTKKNTAKSEKKPVPKKKVVAKNEGNVSSKKEINDTTIKSSVQTPAPAIKLPEPAIKPPEQSIQKKEDEWVGPKTIEEDKPELYTTEENVQFIREFTSDMIIEGKYKIGETIMYLLEKKEKELDTADKAAIDYIIKERLRKDPELIEALKKHNEKQKGGNKSISSSNSNPGQTKEIDMPPYMVKLLSPSFSISQYDSSPEPEIASNPTPIPTPDASPLSLQSLFMILFPPSDHNSFNFHSSSHDDDDDDPFSNLFPSSGGLFGTNNSPFRSRQSASPIQSLFRFDDDEDTGPFSNGRSNIETDTGISSPSRSQSSWSSPSSSYPQPKTYSSFHSNPNPNTRSWGYSWTM